MSSRSRRIPITSPAPSLHEELSRCIVRTPCNGSATDRDPSTPSAFRALRETHTPLRMTVLKIRLRPFFQILVFIPKIVPRVAHNRLFFRRPKPASELPRRPHPQRSRLNDRLLGNQRPGGNDRSRADAGSVQND